MTPSSAKQDAETLIDLLMPLVEQNLRKHGEFYPVGGQMLLDGKISLASAWTGNDRPQSQTIIDMLKHGFRAQAKAGEIGACALLYDALVTPPGTSTKTDAIAASIDHRDNYAVTAFYPYQRLSDGSLSTGTPFAVNRISDVFEHGGA